jgi:uncharacterized glyoxalase superfamily protein PhnB
VAGNQHARVRIRVERFETSGASGAMDGAEGARLFAAGFGALVDRFGIPWSINCETAATQAR